MKFENPPRLTDAALDGTVEELVAARFPQAERPAMMRKVAVRRPTAVFGAGTPASVDLVPLSPAPLPTQGSADPKPADRPIAPLRPAGPPPVTPRAEDRYEFRFTGTKLLRGKLQAAQDLLRHSIPNGDVAAVIDRALTSLLADLARAKFSATDRPLRSRGTAPGSRDIPAEVERDVWLRDEARCAFVAASGRRCESTAFLEFHHIRPHGVGGQRLSRT